MTSITTRVAVRRLLTGTLAVLIGLLTVSTALALDKDDLLRLHEAGLDSGTIVNVIRGTTEELELTAEDVDDLEAAGLPADVLSELRLQLGLEQGQEGTTQSIQEELEEQQRLEAERLRIEQERREQERQRLREEMEAESEREQTVEVAYQELRRARNLANRGNYMAAAAVYSNFIDEVQPVVGSQEWYDAKFGMVDALYRAGARGAIRGDVLELALMGSDWNHFEDSVRILRAVVNDSGFASPRIADLSNEIVNGYSTAFQDEFHYFMGRYFYNAGDFQQALTHLASVDANGEFGARAAFLSGVILINPEVGENIRAVRSFEDAIIVADAESEVDREVVENAYLALARIAYQVGNFGGALYYYEKIGPESQRSTTAMFEGAWTYFLSGDMNRALGAFQSLESPYHNHRFFPDVWVLEAAAYLFVCRIDEAHDAVATFEETIGPLREQVEELLATVSDPMIYYDSVLFPDENREAGNPSLPLRVRQTVLADTDFYNLYGVIEQLQSEIELLESTSEDFGARGETILSSLEVELNNKRIELGLMIRDIIHNLSLELDDWWFKSQEVEIEIGDLEASYLETILAHGETAITEGSALFVVPDDWVFWPWEGEYWLDEVGNYRGHLTTRCPDEVEF